MLLRGVRVELMTLNVVWVLFCRLVRFGMWGLGGSRSREPTTEALRVEDTQSRQNDGFGTWAALLGCWARRNWQEGVMQTPRVVGPGVSLPRVSLARAAKKTCK